MNKTIFSAFISLVLIPVFLEASYPVDLGASSKKLESVTIRSAQSACFVPAENCKYFQAFLNEEQIGEIAYTESLKSVTIHTIFIKEDFQRQGIGKQLICRVIRETKCAYVSAMALKKVEGFYKKIGFIKNESGIYTYRTWFN